MTDDLSGAVTLHWRGGVQTLLCDDAVFSTDTLVAITRMERRLMALRLREWADRLECEADA